jgi:hypothetical protein
MAKGFFSVRKFLKDKFGIVKCPAVGVDGEIFTAAGSDNTDATAITDTVSVVRGADDSKGVILPASPGAGAVYVLHNAARFTLKVYPGSGDTINGGAANSPVQLGAKKTAVLYAISNSAWSAILQ